MTTASSYQSRKFNRQFWFVHISGLPYLFFTTLPDNWSVPSGWTYETGLAIDDLNIDRTIDILGGVEDATSVMLNIYGSTFSGLIARNTYYSTSAEMTTESMDANEDSNIEVVHEMAGAASSGLIYRGNETISYTGKSGTTFTGIDRGRYYYLDDNLDEVKWKPAFNYIGTGPLITTTPKTMRGRIATIYRSYFDDDGNALDKSEHEVMFRGYIETFGQTRSGLGITISAKSIIDLLDREIFKPAEVRLHGYQFPNSTNAYGQMAKGTGLAFKETRLDLNEETENSVDPTYSELSLESRRTRHIRIYIPPSDVDAIDTPDELIKYLNGKLQDAYINGRCELPWQIHRVGSRVSIVSDFVGWTYYGDNPYQVIRKGETYAYSGLIVGEIEITAILKALGFSGEIGTTKKLRYGGTGSWKSHFARYTNPSHYSSYINQNLPYERPGITSSQDISSVWFDLVDSNKIPIKASEEAEDFVMSPGDGSQFYVSINEEHIMQLDKRAITSSDEVLYMINRAELIKQHIGTLKEKETTVVSVDDGEFGYARQAWIPSGKQTVSVGGGKYEDREGVQYTILQLLTSTGTKGYNGQFDILPANWGVELPEGFIDTESFEKIANKHPQAALDRRYVIDRSFNFREMLDAECKLLGFLIVVNNGRITCVDAMAPTYNALAQSIDYSNIKSDTQTLIQLAPEGLYNQIRIKLNYDVFDDKYYHTADYVSLSSIIDNRKIEQHEIECRGVRSDQWKGDKKTTDEITSLMEDLLDVISDESYIYETTCSRAVDTLSLGSVVNVTDDKVLNPKHGTIGIDKHIGIVEAIGYNVESGTVNLTIRLRYDWDVEYSGIEVLNNAPVINQGSFAPSVKLVSYTGGTLTVRALNPNAIVNGWRVNDRVQLRDKGTGQTLTTTITAANESVIGGTAEITIADNYPSAIDLSRAELTYRKQDDLIVNSSNLELASASISSSASKLKGLINSFKFRF